MKPLFICSSILFIILVTACGSLPLALPEEAKAKSTPTSPAVSGSPLTLPTATPKAKVILSQPTPTVAKGTIKPLPGNTLSVQYSAEKISLAPMELNLDINALSTQGDRSRIGFNSWSNNVQKFAFRIPSSNILTDPAAPKGNNTFTASELWLANIDGTGTQKIADQTGSLILWSPDDTQIVYYKRIGVSKHELWVVNLATTVQTRLDKPTGIDINNTDYYSFIAWFDNHRLLYGTYPLAGKSTTMQRHLWLHDIQTGQIKEVLISEELRRLSSNFWLAPNRTLIAGNTYNDLWVGRLVEENSQFRIEYIKPLLVGNSLIPRWSPDSTKLAVRSYGGATFILRIIELNSGKIVEIPFESNVAQVEWSPDSQMIVVSNDSVGNPLVNLQGVNADGSNLRLLSLSSDNYFQWAPNGQYMFLKPAIGESSGNALNIFEVEVKP